MQLLSTDPQAEGTNPPESVPCPFCGTPQPWRGYQIFGRTVWTTVETCQCAEAQAEKARQEREKAEAEKAEKERAEAAERRARIERLIGSSGLGRRFLSRTFDSFKVTEGNRIAAQNARSYAHKFATMTGKERNGFFIFGQKGTGKTHLAAAISNELMRQGVPVVFATMIDLLAKIKETFDSGGKAEADLLRLYTQADLLIIDDLGKEQPTEWALTKIYQIINARYEDFRPVIVTSNYTLEELVERLTPRGGDRITADATIDRLREMTYTLSMQGESWRGK